MKKQVIVIHGGDTFDTYEEYLSSLKNFEIDFERLRKKGWKDGLQTVLGEDFEVVLPAMPNKSNSKYLEWKIWFEKLTPFFAEHVILVGHSLGGIFLVKYFAENKFSKTIQAVFLVASPYDDVDSDYTLADFILPKSLELLSKQGGTIFLYHSKDDPVVPFTDFEKYRKALPGAVSKVFENRGHFSQEEFPELVKDIRSLIH